MKSTPSPRVRVLAVLALVAAAGAAAFVLMRSPDTASSPAVIQTTHTPAQTTTTAAATSTTSTTKKSRPKKHTTKPKPSQSGMAALDAALVAHPVVVVSLYSPDVATDVAAMKEARAGAASVGAGFVAFNVYNEKQARQIATLLGSDSQAANPEVLFFKRPRKLAFELHGFVDSQVVAQAAENVLPRVEVWTRDANRICSRYTSSLGPAEAKVKSADLTTAAGRKQGADGLQQAAALISEEAQTLSEVHVTVAKAGSYAKLIADLRQAAANMNAEAQALRQNETALAQSIDKKNATLAEAINALVSELHITSCAQ